MRVMAARLSRGWQSFVALGGIWGICLVRGVANDNRNPLSRYLIVNDVLARP